MKMKHVSILAVVMAASVGANSAHAIQKHDPIFRNAYTTVPQKNDRDLVLQVRNQYGSPHGKADLSIVRWGGQTEDRDLVREVRYQNGSPRRKVDPSDLPSNFPPLK
jgi:hypothetical protein